MSEKFEEKVVWITGGGSGIGQALAFEMADRGARVAVSGRRMEKLDETVEELNIRGADGLAVQCDVTDEAQVEAAVEDVVANMGRLDVAVANAGFSVSGAIEELDAEDWRRQFDVNVVGLVMTAKHALPALRETDGRVVLMGSVAGTVAMPGSAPYSASKYAVRSIGQTLSMELADSPVSCTTVQPGFVETEIGQVDNEQNFRESWEDRRPQALLWPREKAARKIADAVAARKREYTFTGHGRVAAFFGKHAPGLVHYAVTHLGDD